MPKGDCDADSEIAGRAFDRGASVPQTSYPEPKDAEAGPEGADRAQDKVRRFSAIQLLIAIVLWIVTVPFFDALRHGDLLGGVLLTLVLFSAVLVVGANRRKLLVASVLVTPAFVGKWVNQLWPDAMPTEVFLVAGMLFVAFVVVNLFHFILTAPQINTEVLCAAASNYLMIGILWLFAYLLLGRLLPDSFVFNAGPASDRSMDSFTALYFSFVTLSTLGFGDIIPVSKVARMLSIVEATTGMFYVTFLIARLVALYSSEDNRRRSDR
jgi:hypothetical protein